MKCSYVLIVVFITVAESAGLPRPKRPDLKAVRLQLLKNLQKQLFIEAGIQDNNSSTRRGRQIQEAEGGAVMYLPLGPGASIRCPTAADAAAVSLAQMTFLATSMNILSVVTNVSNNLNNRNNNNNQISYNVQSNNNVVTNTNVNNGNQVNVMVPVLNP